MRPSAFDLFSGTLAILAGLTGLLYSISYIIISQASEALGLLLSALFLTLTGLFASGALVGLYNRLRGADAGFALWGLVLGLAGAFGSLIHGGYDLANAINVPDAIPANIANLPNPVDPRGLLTFGAAGMALFIFSWMMGRSRAEWPNMLVYFGYALAVMSAVLYLGRLTVLQVTTPIILIPALLAGFILNPGFYLMLGLALRRGRKA